MKKKRFLPLLLCFIFIDETCNNYILNAFTRESSFYELILYSFFLLLSIIASPIQSGYSDFYCRKKSLVVSLSLSLASVIPVFFITKSMFSPLVFFPFVILAKAGFGNTLPLSWAAISDTQEKNFRFSLGLSTSAMAFGYLILIVINKLFSDNQTSLIIFLILAFLIYLCVTKFEDIRDKKKLVRESIVPLNSQKWGLASTFSYEVKSIVNDFLKDRRTRKGLSAFMLWEISFYSALISDVDLKIREFKNISFSMLIGYFSGVLLLRLLNKKTDHEMIKFGYIISIISIVPIFILWPFFDIRLLIITCYFFYALAAAFLAPSLFSILSKERKPHEQGKIYGLIDSSDTVSFLLASISLILYHYLHLNQFYLVSFSFITFLISLWPYEKFRKLRPRNLRSS